MLVPTSNADHGLKIKERRKLVAFDMDGTLLNGRLISSLAEKFGFSDSLGQIEKDSSLLGYDKTKRIASLLTGISQKDILYEVGKLGLVKNWRYSIEEIKARGYVIGIISDSYDIACRYLKDKIGFDFEVSNELEIKDGICTGFVSMPLGWEKIGCSCKISVCKRYHLQQMARHYKIPPQNTVAIGDSIGDICMISTAGTGIALAPKNKELEEKSPVIIREHDLNKILPFVLR